MPGFDRTGPMGYGPMTGRSMGPCGRGAGIGMGSGRGFGRRYWKCVPAGVQSGYSPVRALTRDQEIADLKAERESIEQELNDIEARLKELEKK